MQITRQRVRPEMNIVTNEKCLHAREQVKLNPPYYLLMNWKEAYPLLWIRLKPGNSFLMSILLLPLILVKDFSRSTGNGTSNIK